MDGEPVGKLAWDREFALGVTALERSIEEPLATTATDATADLHTRLIVEAEMTDAEDD
jgi:hypothetical protein